jgi:hypothetical protein
MPPQQQRIRAGSPCTIVPQLVQQTLPGKERARCTAAKNR